LRDVISGANILERSSHVQGAMGEPCDRALRLDHGGVVIDRKPNQVLKSYVQAAADVTLVNALSPTDRAFAQSELNRIFISDDELRSTCSKRARSFWPSGQAAAPLVRDQVVASLRDRAPLSLLRVGNGEGNAMSMTKGSLHPLQVSTFYMEFVGQNGISIPLNDAITLCGDIKTALVKSDIIGFRSFRFDERAFIQRFIDEGNAYGALGCLYAREFFQDGLRRNYWSQSVVTSAWIHLDLIPYLGELLDAANSIIVITGRPQLGELMRARAGSRLEAFLTVPVQGYRPPSIVESHFGRDLSVVRESLSRDLSGTLVLVGAGHFGKIYCAVARNHGAVAIDLGSAFDVLAGLKTRPIHDMYNIDALRWM
jgi:glycosyltransferase GT-like protein